VFGEKREDRRERLRTVIIKDRQARGLDIDLDGSGDDGSSDDAEDEEEKEKEEEFYTEGDDALEKARRYLTAYSVPRAKKRIQRQRMEASVPLSRILDTRKSVFSELKVSPALPLLPEARGDTC
jgi:U4/U6 small nuclear ribonucleoprotein PRP4